MGSQYDGDQTKMRSGYPMMGYPPPTPAVAGYPGYPPASNGYPCTAPPPATYYANGYPAAPPPPYNSGAYHLVQRVLIGITAGLAMMGVLLFLIWFVIRPRDPVVKIDTISVSNFTIADSKLNAIWDVGFNIWNPNSKLDMQCNKMDILIFYKRNLLSSAFIPPFLLGKTNGTTMHENLLTREDLVDDGMEEDFKTGALVVSVRLRILASFQNEGAVTKDQKMAVLCENLRIYFDSGTGNGKSPPGPWVCLLYEL